MYGLGKLPERPIRVYELRRIEKNLGRQHEIRTRYTVTMLNRAGKKLENMDKYKSFFTFIHDSPDEVVLIGWSEIENEWQRIETWENYPDKLELVRTNREWGKDNIELSINRQKYASMELYQT